MIVEDSAWRPQTLRIWSCTNDGAACLCHSLAWLSGGRLHNSNNNALVDADSQTCAQMQVRLKIARALSFFGRGDCCFLRALHAGADGHGNGDDGHGHGDPVHSMP
jgi:hypothetical protein